MKKQSIKKLKLTKDSISNLSTNAIIGGSGVNCVTQEGSCQTTSCVCTKNPHCLKITLSCTR
jgi:hypothetical protein